MRRTKTPPPIRQPAPASTAPSAAPGSPAWRALLLPAGFAAALIGLGLLVPRPQLADLSRAMVGAGAFALLWAAALLVSARAAGRRLALSVVIHRHHWVQACAQATVFLYWGWHVRFVYAFAPLLLAQLLFAYAVDALLQWSRRDSYSLGFGPFPIIGSINLFLWFRPEHFHWQFAMILVGFLAKELIRWRRDGRSAHIFNPSSFPLAVFALALILLGRSDLTLANQIVTSQFNVPGIYLVIFLAALPGQLLFGVARMTMAAVVTLVGISAAYFAATGTYLFFDAHIPVPVFLGMHLLFTDPATSPRRGAGRLLFGALYAVGVAAFFVLLGAVGAPTYFDKLLPLPILNLLARRIDALTAGEGAPAPAPSIPRNLAYTAAWAATFAVLMLGRALGDRHPGQYLPFWQEACAAGKDRACSYVAYRESIYCAQGSGWACNEWGVRLAARGLSPREAFERGCRAGDAAACENRERGRGAELARAPVPVRELPIVLSWKGKVRERDPAALLAMACEQGWPGSCG